GTRHPSLPTRWSLWVIAPLACVILAISLLQLTAILHFPPWTRPKIVRMVYEYAAPLHSVNHYGLFAIMTTRRIELVIEGSNDGKNWLPYEFKYKPGDVK